MPGLRQDHHISPTVVVTAGWSRLHAGLGRDQSPRGAVLTADKIGAGRAAPVLREGASAGLRMVAGSGTGLRERVEDAVIGRGICGGVVLGVHAPEVVERDHER